MLGAAWRKSTYSFSNGNCIEVRWKKSSYSCANGNCVEAAIPDGTVCVRDSKDPGPVLSFSPAAWEALLGSIRARS